MYSVIIPSLGRLEYLNELIDSVLCQTVCPKEILILLDDNMYCREISSLLRQDPLVRVHRCESMNLAQKRNYGAEMAICDNLLFTDDDDLWAPTRAKRVLDTLVQFQVCCHNYGKFGDQSGPAFSKLGLVDVTLGPGHLLGGANIFGGGSAIAAKKEIVRAFPFSGEFIFCEDFEWWTRILLAGVMVRYLGESLIHYRTHSSNMTRSVTKISYFSLKLSAQLFSRSLWMLAVSASIALRAIARVPYHLIRVSLRTVSKIQNGTRR